MSFVTCIIYLALTIVIPLKQSYYAVQTNTDTKLWAIYWFVYTFVSGLFYVAPFLSEAPFNFIFLCLFVWLYHQSFRGAELLSDLVNQNIKGNEAIAGTINMMAEKLKFLNLFQSENPVSVQKTKTQ